MSTRGLGCRVLGLESMRGRGDVNVEEIKQGLRQLNKPMIDSQAIGSGYLREKAQKRGLIYQTAEVFALALEDSRANPRP